MTEVNFTGDPAGTPSGDNAGEAFLDASSIAAQGNTVYDLSFVSSAHPLPAGPCDVRITGAAPGATILGLSAFSNTHDTTTSNFVQAIDYAVAHGVKVLNESFGCNPFPDTATRRGRIADDRRSPRASRSWPARATPDHEHGRLASTDPKLISVGASTTFRAYQQTPSAGSTRRRRTRRTGRGSTTTSPASRPAASPRSARTRSTWSHRVT